MDTPDYDEYEKKRRKEEAVEYRNKKKNTSVFMTLASLFNIAETIVLIFIMFLVTAFFFFKVFNATGEMGVRIFLYVMIAEFIGGMIGGFFIYKAAIRWAIKKFKLEDKLMDDVLNHYQKKSKEEMEAKLKR